MIDLCIRKRFTTKGTVYEYRFEIAMVNGKRKWKTKSGFKTVTEARKAGKSAMMQYLIETFDIIKFKKTKM